MLFNSMKEINRLRKEINRSWNAKYFYYWEEKLTFSKLRFSRFTMLPGQFLGAPTQVDIIEF